MFPRTEMLDLVVVDGRARGIVDARPGDRQDRGRTRPTPSCSRTGGYGNVFFLSTNAKGCNVTADLARIEARAAVRQPVLHADPPDVHPGRAATSSRSSR